jgi:hypothetical protein
MENIRQFDAHEPAGEVPLRLRRETGLRAESAPPADGVPAPRAPGTLAETGVDEGFLIDLLVKTMYRQNHETVGALGEALCLPLPLVEELLQLAGEARLIEALGQLGASFSAEMRYALSEKGKSWAAEALAQSEWVGPCPVTLEQFQAQAARQSIRDRVLSEAMLRDVFPV